MPVFPPSGPFSKPGSLRCVRSRPLGVRAPRTPPPSRPPLPASHPPSLGSPSCAAPKLPRAPEASAPLRLCAALPHALRGAELVTRRHLELLDEVSRNTMQLLYENCGITFLRSGDLFHLKPCPFFSFRLWLFIKCADINTILINDGVP